MAVITLLTEISAPLETCFDLARSIDFHMYSTSDTGEKAVGGVTSGLIGAHQEVTWRARHFWIWWSMTSRITAYDRPNHFRDSMKRGPFKRFDHDHFFEFKDGITVMSEKFDFNSPFGVIGEIVDSLVMKRHLEELLTERNRMLKKIAETDPHKFLRK